ncbi:aminoglycoside phosphotransferase family protein [Paenibacillaceae bacterium]|nr:aminoglycoside phosphotransferase family protein [Paenibacillaceae bacterium]
MSVNERSISDKTVRRNWRKLKLTSKVSKAVGDSVVMTSKSRTCLKDSFKSSIWSVQLQGSEKKHDVILKIFKTMDRTESLVELNMLRKAQTILRGSMPEVYFLERNVGSDPWWIGMEHVKPIRGQLVFTPYHFYRIIPALAEMHAKTYNDKFKAQQKHFAGWLPQYESKANGLERRQRRIQTKALLQEAMKRADLRKVLSPVHRTLNGMLDKGRLFSPELLKAGQSIVHSDLQTPNMGCKDISRSQWDIQFFDWEGARFAPCWFDVVNLIGVFFAYRKDFRGKEEEVSRGCAELYAHEMGKRGIVFKEEPYRLFKMAYLQRLLEHNLYFQLSWELTGIKKGVLLPVYMQKVQQWSKEFKL